MTAKAALAARILMGLVYGVLGGLNYFLEFIPPPPEPPPSLAAFMTGVMSTGYFMPLLKGTELACGALLLAGRFVPLALVVLAPITVQILFLHSLVEPSGLPIALALTALHLYLGWAYRANFAGVLAAKATPA